MRSFSSLNLFLFFLLLTLIPVIYFKNHSTDINQTKSQPGIPITVFAESENLIYHLNLESYLIGVVAAEMPARFELEALKAQAVAARTIAIYRLRRFDGNSRHVNGADLSDNPGKNQAWVSESSLRSRWGTNYEEYYTKIKKAVEETSGIIMLYNDKPIDAVFHSTCGGKTSSAKEVWGYEIPYLQSTICLFDQHSPHFRNQSNFTWSELSKNLNLSEAEVKSLQIGKHSPSGQIQAIFTKNHLFNGKLFRNKLKLKSTKFSWRIDKVGLIITTNGYGHGVGMCQYGADGLSKKGWNYRQILCHYYRGIRFAQIRQNVFNNSLSTRY